MSSGPTERFEQAMARLDATNAEDPHRVVVDGVPQPRELVYARRMSACLERLAPSASEALRLAVRSQHLRRWAVPRTDYPMDRGGYLQWRARLGRFHAEAAGVLLREVGYDEQTIHRVQSLVRKEHLRTDPEAQTLEDVACLVFLEHHLEDFAREHDEDKLAAILRKTWHKMSPQGHQAALALTLPSDLEALMRRALAGT